MNSATAKRRQAKIVREAATDSPTADRGDIQRNQGTSTEGDSSPPIHASFANLPTKVRDEHRARLAIVYVRQSTQQQVLEHRESTARQYALVERAVSLGWPRERVQVIDDDQGVSGSSAEGRLGFQRLLSEVSTDRVGLILGLEMSRLARSCKDWHALLELCSIYHTLLADADGLYDPADYNDRLLLGLKGTMSEAELHILRSRMYRGLCNKAARGEVLNHAPLGYVRTLAGDFVIDPDEQVRTVVSLIFEQFARRGSVNGLLEWLVEHAVKLPIRPHFGANRGELEWRRPNRVTLLNMLHHPIYAGAYRWGRREIDPRKKKAGRPATGRTVKTHDACRVLIRDRFPAYIPWEQFEENQRKLAANRIRSECLSAPRSGPSVLAGMIVCGHCGHRMVVSYAGGGSTNRLRYTCLRAKVDYGEDLCQRLSGAVLDEFVSERLLQAISPASLELSFSAANDLEVERKRLDEQWRQRVQRAAYDVELARRQYAAVDPENRLVARELERRWEEALRAHETMQAEFVRHQREAPTQLSAVEREWISALSNDLPALWRAETTTPQDRQTIARLLLERVVVSVEGDTDRVDVVLHWSGGFTSRHLLFRPVQKYAQLSNYAELVQRIDDFRTSGRTLAEIAAALNKEGFHPPKRTDRFTGEIVARFLSERGTSGAASLRSVAQADHLQADEWWVSDLAHKLSMPIATLHRWRIVGWVHSRKVADAGGRWAVFANAAELTRLKTLRSTRRGWPDQPYPPELTTPNRPSQPAEMRKPAKKSSTN